MRNDSQRLTYVPAHRDTYTPWQRDAILTIHEVKCLFVEGKSAPECGGGSGGPGRKNLDSS